MLKRICPEVKYDGIPCCIVAVKCAADNLNLSVDDIPAMKVDGYTTLEEANRYIRRYLPVKKRMNYRRGERPLLKDLNLDGKAIVCVYGHFVYVDGNQYWSFFDNADCEVVSIWLLK